MALSHQWNWQLAFAMGYLILFASIVAFSAYVWLIGRDPTTRVASYAYVNPLIALLLGSWFSTTPYAPAVRGSRAGGGWSGLSHRREACCTA